MRFVTSPAVSEAMEDHIKKIRETTQRVVPDEQFSEDLMWAIWENVQLFVVAIAVSDRPVLAELMAIVLITTTKYLRHRK
jgi:hypothetical protein